MSHSAVPSPEEERTLEAAVATMSNEELGINGFANESN